MNMLDQSTFCPLVKSYGWGDKFFWLIIEYESIYHNFVFILIWGLYIWAWKRSFNYISDAKNVQSSIKFDASDIKIK